MRCWPAILHLLCLGTGISKRRSRYGVSFVHQSTVHKVLKASAAICNPIAGRQSTAMSCRCCSIPNAHLSTCQRSLHHSARVSDVIPSLQVLALEACQLQLILVIPHCTSTIQHLSSIQQMSRGGLGQTLVATKTFNSITLQPGPL